MGEGEVKMYLDGDSDSPTLVGTGTEDYLGSGWGQDQFANLYQGSHVVDSKKNAIFLLPVSRSRPYLLPK